MREQIPIRTALLCTVAFLSGIGLLAIYASSSVSADQSYNDSFFYLKRQTLTLFAGFIMIFAMGYLPVKFFHKLPLPLFLLATVFLLMALIPPFAHSAKGASRWVRLFPGLTFQPGELAKIALILFLAKNLAIGKRNIKNWSSLALNLAAFAAFALLLMLQPDFGTTFLLFMISFILLFVAGMSRKHISILIGTGVAGFIAAVVSAPYRMKRLLTFLDPWQEAYNGGFQIIQSFVGFQNGGVLGLGLGESKQKLFFLPDAHTDFILSVIGEELGAFGVILVCTLFVYLCHLATQIALRQTDTYLKFTAFGITVMICTQAALNMGVAMGLLPTKGIPLPFVSHGRSSLIVFLFCVGILCRLCQPDSETKSRVRS